MKSYLRIEPKACFGVIASPKCSAIYDFSGNLAISAGVQDVSVWNLRYGSQVSSGFICVITHVRAYDLGFVCFVSCIVDCVYQDRSAKLSLLGQW
jgi:hypothetical protein